MGVGWVVVSVESEFSDRLWSRPRQTIIIIKLLKIRICDGLMNNNDDNDILQPILQTSKF